MGQPKADNEPRDPTKGEMQARCEGELNGIDRQMGLVQYGMTDTKRRCAHLAEAFAETFTDEEKDTLTTIKEAIEEIESEHGETISTIRSLTLELQQTIQRRGIRSPL